jgi:hypothetical protein
MIFFVIFDNFFFASADVMGVDYLANIRFNAKI